MKTLLKGGTVVSGSGSQVCDVLIDGEKIERVAAQITCPEANVVDVTGSSCSRALLTRTRILIWTSAIDDSG